MIGIIHTLSHVMYNDNIQDFIKYGRRCRLWFCWRWVDLVARVAFIMTLWRRGAAVVQ